MIKFNRYFSIACVVFVLFAGASADAQDTPYTNNSPAMNEQNQMQSLYTMQALQQQRDLLGSMGVEMPANYPGMMSEESMREKKKQDALSMTAAPTAEGVNYKYDKAKMEGPFAGVTMPQRLFNNIPARGGSSKE